MQQKDLRGMCFASTEGQRLSLHNEWSCHLWHVHVSYDVDPLQILTLLIKQRLIFHELTCRQVTFKRSLFMKFINPRKQKLVYIAKLDFPPIYDPLQKILQSRSPTPTSKLQKSEGANRQDFSFSFGFLFIFKKEASIAGIQSPS